MAPHPLTVVTFCHRGPRPIYEAWHVCNLRRMFAKHLTVPHNFVCVTDDVTGMQAHGIDAHPLWDSPNPLPSNRHWLFNYNRLRLFDPWAAEHIGPRLLCIDLDVVIRANIDDIVNVPEPFKIISLRARTQLNGGLFLIEPGRAPLNPWQLLHDDPKGLIERSHNWVGSDQAVLSELFYGSCATWNEDDGVIINQFEWPQWRIFLRTGANKCWVPHMPECETYLRESGATTPAPIPPPHHMPRSVQTPGGARTRVRRYITRRV